MPAIIFEEDGIVLKSFQEVREELRADWRQIFNGIDLSPATPDGHHVDLEAKVITDSFQAVQTALTNLDRRYSGGHFLELLAAFLGLERRQASYAAPLIKFSGEEETVIPAGTTVTFEGSAYNFALEEEITIGNSGNASGYCVCDTAGQVDLKVGSWDMVSTTPSGVTCEYEGPTSYGGSDRESDESLRARMDAADITGLATADGMLTYLRNEIGPDISLIVNDEPTTDADGIPGHSFRVVVPTTNGTPDSDIAQAIWVCKPSGIRPDGNVEAEATDKKGLKHVMKFSRPSAVGVDVKIVLTLYTEEAFPVDGTYAVKKAIEGWAFGTDGWPSPEYTPGKDVILARFYTPILTVPGIGSAVIQAKKHGSDTWSSSNIAISSQEIATLSSLSVEVGS